MHQLLRPLNMTSSSTFWFYLSIVCCVGEMCVGSSASQSCSYRKICHGIEYDTRQAVCCEKVLFPGAGLSCCGKKPFNAEVATCCEYGFEADVTLGLSQSVSSCCGLKAYNCLNEICCGSSIVTKPAANAGCCGEVAVNEDLQICCKGKIRTRLSGRHQCCGLGQFDKQTQCCCWTGVALMVQPKNHRCCLVEAGHPAAPAVYNPHAHELCDDGTSPKYQCCAKTSKILTEDGEDFSDAGEPHTPSKGTTCCSTFHSSQGLFCCGADVYDPGTEMCCGGHRRQRRENWGCCGADAYDVLDREKKCCAGTLHPLTSDASAHGAQCCGSILQKSSDVCCVSWNKQVLYPSKPTFSCCGHLYFNTSLWWCCGEKLHPLPKPGPPQIPQVTDFQLVSLINLRENDLCAEMFFGTLESASLNAVVFRDVMNISGRCAKVSLSSSTHHILQVPDHCSFPKLIPGRSYFFNNVTVIADFHHDSFDQTLQFILSQCHR